MDDSLKRRNFSWVGLIIRFVVAAIALMITAFFTPGYVISSFWTALLQAVAIVGLDYVIQVISGIDASPFGRGLSGFLVSALIIYLTKFVIPGVYVSIVGALIAALIIGVIDVVLPIKIM